MATLCRQMKVVVKDRVGALAELADHIRDARVNIRAICAWVQDGQGHLRMVTSNNRKACQAIRDLVERCEEEQAICATMPAKIGSLAVAARKLAQAGISIEMAYGSALGRARQAMLVVKTTDDARALELL